MAVGWSKSKTNSEGKKEAARTLKSMRRVKTLTGSQVSSSQVFNGYGWSAALQRCPEASRGLLFRSDGSQLLLISWSSRGNEKVVSCTGTSFDAWKAVCRLQRGDDGARQEFGARRRLRSAMGSLSDGCRRQVCKKSDLDLPTRRLTSSRYHRAAP